MSGNWKDKYPAIGATVRDIGGEVGVVASAVFWCYESDCWRQQVVVDGNLLDFPATDLEEIDPREESPNAG